VGGWFDPSDSARIEAERTDEYLLLPGCTTTGVKLREERLEIKAQVHPSEAVAYGETLSGRRDAWVKWSRPVGDAGALRNVRAADDDLWIYVAKARRLRLLSLDCDTPTEPAEATARVTNGCQFELSTVRAAAGRLDEPPSAADWSSARAWWSLSLEAFAPWSGDGTAPLFDNLEAGAQHLFGSLPPVELALPASYSYPAWLQRFTRP
jgi:hypothetical protein